MRFAEKAIPVSIIENLKTILRNVTEITFPDDISHEKVYNTN